MFSNQNCNKNKSINENGNKFFTLNLISHFSFFLLLFPRALSDLSMANIIKYDCASHTVESLAEAHIMTRHMITFKSMVLMMKLPRDCDVPLLFKELCGCDEMLKPLRRNEKAILNGFMKGIRYPVKSKVRR